MDSKKMISFSLVAVAIIFVIYGFYRMNNVTEMTESVSRQDQSGMYILSVGFVLLIFAMGSLVGKKN